MFYSATVQTIQNRHFHNHCINIISNNEPLLPSGNGTKAEHSLHHPKIVGSIPLATDDTCREYVKNIETICNRLESLSMFYSLTVQTIQNRHFHSHCINIISNSKPLRPSGNSTKVEHSPYHPKIVGSIPAAADDTCREYEKNNATICKKLESLSRLTERKCKKETIFNKLECLSMFYSLTVQTIQNWHSHNNCIKIISNSEPLLPSGNSTEIEELPHHPKIVGPTSRSTRHCPGSNVSPPMANSF